MTEPTSPALPSAPRLWTVELRYGDNKMVDTVQAGSPIEAIERLCGWRALSPAAVTSANAVAL
jgi:hypothetical protein